MFDTTELTVAFSVRGWGEMVRLLSDPRSIRKMSARHETQKQVQREFLKKLDATSGEDKIGFTCCQWGRHYVWGNLANKIRHSELACIQFQGPFSVCLRS